MQSEASDPSNNFSKKPTLNRALIRHKNNNKKASSVRTSILCIDGDKGGLKRKVEEHAVAVFARRDCCLNLALKRLLPGGLGANLVVYEVEEKDVNYVVRELEFINAGSGGRMQLPTVFIDGRWFGGLDRVLVTHMTGELTSLLKQVGALWTL